MGEQVLASNPSSEAPAQAEPITDVIIGTGNKHLVDVTVRDSHGHSSTVVATDQHPFWVADTHTWTDAAQLQPGQHLVQAAATGGVAVSAVVVAVHRGVHFQQVYNLTVHTLHTYYIHTTTGTNLLVHNCGTVPEFRPGEADSHYRKHVLGVERDGSAKAGGADMPEYLDKNEYVSAAQDLMYGQAGPGVLEGARGTDVLRFELSTGRLGDRN